MKNKLYEILVGDFQANHFIRIGDNKALSLYVGRDEQGHYAFDYRGKFNPVRIPSSEVISVTHIKQADSYFLRFSLEKTEFLEFFCTFCEDLMYSTSVISEDETAYQTIRTRYYSWKQLFKPNRGHLTEYEIMGLIGELLFLKEYLIPIRGLENALESWTGPEKTHKDFSFDKDWFEVKTVSFGKETVRISSIEQLDSDIDGSLVIYSLERMSPSFNGVKLNSLVMSIISSLSNVQQKEEFMSKLDLFGFTFSPDYDSYVYDNKGGFRYCVGVDFPRVKRQDLPDAIVKAQYEIMLSDIESFVVEKIKN